MSVYSGTQYGVGRCLASLRTIARSFAAPLCIPLFVIVFLTGCSQRPDEAPSIRSLLPTEAVDPTATKVRLENGDALPVVGNANDGVHRVLALSQGGINGAYGAGVLGGWSASGNRPTFDVITGVSTGALLAAMVFAGQDYDPLIKELYTTLDAKDIFRNKGLGGLFGDSLYSNEPLKRQIESVVTDEFLGRIAAEHNKGRRFYIATTNLDAGELTIWDMGRIAQGGRTNTLLHFQKVLRASAAIPAFFQPVYIKPQRGIQLRQAHVDGGVKEPLLVTDFMFDAAAKRKELYVIINGSLKRQNASQPVKANLTSISRKAILELTRELQEDTLYRDYVLARRSGASFRLTSIPEDFPQLNNLFAVNPERMQQLYDLGYQAGLKGPDSWEKVPPRLGRFERTVQ